ncbi:DUF5655 domain-containing protein [Ignatzschineria sp. RMDPL8A]|uniref:DUF5655 domain-containing protein n=1 Tax=Ignatzschineria sp. RMDPL8A TaxID=2999236 RepID=UPI0024465DBA|nr:DUF5655 domain-containing protein [Ignatzschineria sp. RMDPL8A]MDG9729052.1 DUF5655 domain-containing protein [Ignatzschineria sp. RMDPL8A]
MDIYKIGSHELQQIKEQPFKLEKEMQALFEANLMTLTGLTLVKTEFSLKQFRFDTLAFDEEKQAFVVIEYKRDKSQSVVDQGVSYLNAMLEYKDSLMVEYNEQSLGKILKRSDIDWSQSRILFVANTFNDYQKNATNFKNLGIELIEFKRYHNDLLTVNFIERSKNAPSLPQPISDSAELTPLASITKEIKVYDEESFYQLGSESTIELYERFKQAILNLDDQIELVYTKYYAAFKKDKTTIVDIVMQKRTMILYINAVWGTLDDPKAIFRDMRNIGHWGNGDYEISLKDTEQLEYILSVIKQKL